MNVAKLFVDGQEADFYKSEELAPRITRKIFDLTELSGASGDFTLSLVLPDTARNDRLFGWAGDVQAKQPFFSQPRRKAYIEVDGQVVIRGSLSIDSREPKGYGATILGSSVAWAELIGDKTLRELTTFPRWLWTGIRSTNFHPWPEHIAGSVGLKDVWPTSEGGQYEMQFPLVAYGNFDCKPDPDAIAAYVTAGSKVVSLDNPSDLELVRLAIGKTIRGAGIANGTYVDFIGGGSTQQFDMTVAATTTQFTELVFDGSITNPINGLESCAHSGGIIDGALIYNDKVDWAFDQFSFRGGGFVRDIFRRIFSEIGYRVGGTWFDDPANNNLLVPYTDSSGAEPEWNWGTLGRYLARMASQKSYFYAVDDRPGNFPFYDEHLGPPPSPFLDPDPYYSYLHYTNIIDGFNEDFPGDFKAVYSAILFYRAPFDDVREDYSFSGRKEQWLAPVDQIADVRVEFEINNYRLSVHQDNPGVDILAEDDNLTASPFRRTLLMLVKNPPERPEDWGDMGTAYLKDGFAIPADHESILAYTDLSVISTSNFPDPISISTPMNLGVVYLFTGNAVLTVNNLELHANDRLVVVVGQQAALNIESNKPIFGGINYVHDYYTCQQIEIENVTLTVSNIRKPDGTPYPTHLTTAALLPDINQIDFVKSFITQCNLFVAVTPESKLVTLNYADTFLLPGETAVNWTKLVDMGQAVVTPACRYKRFAFEMEQEEGECMLDWKTKRVVITNDDRMATESFEARIIFAPTATRIFTWAQSPGIKIPLPCLNTREELAKFMGDLGSGAEVTKLDYAPRLLKWRGFINTHYYDPPFYFSTIPFAVGEFTTETLLAFPMNDSAAPDFIPDEFFLPWATVVDDFQWPGSTGLYDRFYAASVRALLKAIKVSVPAMISPSDMQTLDQRKPVVIDGVVYTCNTVQDFNPVKPSLTKTILIRRY